DTQPSCEGSDAMGWLLCPFIEGIYYVSDAIFTHFIIPFLIVEPVNTNEGPVYAIWSSFRTIGNILLVFGLLFIVFGQAIGGGLVDAYTAKKAMPRIFLAAILINLSIYIVAFLVDMGNILGAGIGELISSPLAATGQDELAVSGAVTVVVIIGLAASAGLVLMLMTVIRNSSREDNKDMVKVALYTVAFLAIPAVLVVLGIFFTLTIRLGLILLLTVMSPVALALFVMPATEKWAKKWLDWLIKSILVYPIMIAIFAIAGVLSSLISGNSGGLDIMEIIKVLLPIFLGGLIVGGASAKKPGGMGRRGGTAIGIILGGGVALTGLLATTDMTVSDLMFGLVSIVVLFIPMALIPFSFKLAGGVMGSLVGAVAKGRSSAEKLFMGDKHNQHSRYYGIIGQSKEKRKAYTAKYRAHLDRLSRGEEQGRSGEGGPIAAGTPKASSERRHRRAVFRKGRFGVQQPIVPVIAPDGIPTDEVASGGQGDENPLNRRGNRPPAGPAPAGPAPLPTSEPINLRPKPVGWTPPSRQNVDDLKNRFGNQQQSNAEDITPEDISFT
ncbi:MAG: hypothetical protein Q7T41_01430, partial [Candidatus Saccharibacteria bacterium]|nr:hypothetical protein [Candidatus Saccharibacteria bacterium]